jgi:hypothetical protein
MSGAEKNDLIGREGCWKSVRVWTLYMFVPFSLVFASLHVHALHLLLLDEERESTSSIRLVDDYLPILVTLVC